MLMFYWTLPECFNLRSFRRSEERSGRFFMLKGSANFLLISIIHFAFDTILSTRVLYFCSIWLVPVLYNIYKTKRTCSTNDVQLVIIVIMVTAN